MWNFLMSVSFPLRLGFFWLPLLLAFAGQVFLCKQVKRSLRWLFPLLSGGLLVLVVLYKFTGFLAFCIGGFVALLLVGTAGCVLLGSLLGFLVWRSLHNRF